MSVDIFSDSQPTAPQITAKGFKPNWVAVGLCLVIVYLLIGQRGCSIPSPMPDERIAIDDNGNYALILFDGSESGQDNLTDGQETTINSTDVLSWCRANDFTLRVQDFGSDFSKMEPIWQTLRDKAASAPSLTGASGGKVVTGALPDGPQPTINALESLK